MNRNAFLTTLIDVLKFDDKFRDIEKKDQIIRMLARADINFVPQYAFSSHMRSGQRWEDVEIRFPVPILNEANQNIEDLRELVRYVYEESDDYALQNISIRPLVINTHENITEYNVVFNQIQETVIQGIRDARFVIWAAVAWFSNEAIFQELLIKKKAGLSVRIIVSNEASNIQIINKLKNEEFDVKVIQKWGFNNYNRMHDKFCIIDMDYVMHGSYNWTLTANNNEETLATALDHELVSKFATEFMNLYNS